MKKIFNELRLKWFLTQNSIGYTRDYLERVYEIYINHKKIIHWRDGHPVYSLSTPPLYSKASSNLFARQMFSSIQNKQFPNLLSFAVNDECNVHCAHCSFYEGVHDKTRKVLSLAECKKLIVDAQELGVSIINFVGGEPLMRSDLCEIIKTVNPDLSATTLFTNGWLLEEKAAELKKSGLGGVYVSIDADNAQDHDTFRGKKGAFDRAIAGIKKAKEVGLTVGIATCISPSDFQKGDFAARTELARKLKVHEFLVFDAKPTGRFKKRKDLVDNTDWIQDMITESKQYNQNPDYPGILIYAYTTSYKSTGCSGGTSYFYVSPYGDISPCDFNHATFGNVREKPLHLLWDNLTNQPEFRSSSWTGCKLTDSQYSKNKNVSGQTSSGCSECSGGCQNQK